MTRWAFSLWATGLVTSCANDGAGPSSLLITLTLGEESAQLTAANVLPGEADPLGMGAGPIEIELLDEMGNAITTGRLADPRWSVGEEPLEPDDALPESPAFEQGILSITLPLPASGRGEIIVRLPGRDGTSHESRLALDVSRAVGASSAPLRERAIGSSRGEVGATRAALLECPEALRYGDWPRTSEGTSSPFPDEPRSVYWGCGRMEHVGGEADPRGRLLIAIYPSRGRTCASDGTACTESSRDCNCVDNVCTVCTLTNTWARDDFLEAAEAAATAMLDRVEVFRRNRMHLSFYALTDQDALDGSDFTRGCGAASACCGTGSGQTETIDAADTGYWYWRTRGAAYGPLPRFEFHGTVQQRERQLTAMRAPDFHVGLIDGKCPGWGMYPGPVLTVGTRFNSYVGLPAGMVSYSVSEVAAPIGDRMAHELGHALGGLGDEYGTPGGTPNAAACIGEVGTNAAGDRPPNLAARTPSSQSESAAPWACYIGRSPQLECPDHAISSRSYVREADAIPGTVCDVVTPCSDSLMRGFAALSPQFDPVASNVMTAALDRFVDASLPAPYPVAPCGTKTCAPNCSAVMCGNDGCDTDTCAAECSCTGGIECINALGVAVCSGTRNCSRTIDVPQYMMNEACSEVLRRDDTFIVSNCAGQDVWRPIECTTYERVDDCFAGAIAMPPP